VSSHPAVRAVAAFATPDPVLGSRVAVVVELHDGADVAVDELLEHASRSLRSFMVPERVSFTDAIPRNPMGKIARHDLATLYDGTAVDARPTSESQPAPAAPDGVVAAVLDVYSHVLGRAVVDPDASFFDLGADSLHTMYLHLELEQRFGLSIQPATFARMSSASALAAHLAKQRERSGTVTVNEFQPGATAQTLVFSPSIDGSSWIGFGVAKRELAPGRRIVGLSLEGPHVLERGPRTLADLAQEYALGVRGVTTGPYVIIGHSLGAHAGVATANALISQGEQVDLVVVLDDDAELTRRSFGAAHRAPAARTIAAFSRHAVDLSPAVPFPGRIVLVRCEEDDADYRSDQSAGWGEIALGGARALVLAGNHNSLVREDNLPILVPVLLEAIEADHAEGPLPALTTDRLRSLRYEARVARPEGRLAVEIARYREAIALDRDQPSWVYENLAVALSNAKDDEGADRALDEALARDPWPLSIALRFAPTWAHAGDPRGYLGRAVERSRHLVADHPSVLRQRGLLASRAGLQDEAEASYREGLDMAPEHHGLHVALGELLRRERRYAEAAWVIGDLNRINPGHGWLNVLEAQLELEAGKPNAALAVLDRAPGFVDVPHEARLTRGRILLALGRDDEALAAFRDAAEIAPGSPEPPRLASLVLERLGRHDEAREWAGQAEALANA
jgi:thioesterase domain-containing protein/acyl carrier protein/Flp pilus assembly protein TadD